jgi:hypothetical protein
MLIANIYFGEITERLSNKGKVLSLPLVMMVIIINTIIKLRSQLNRAAKYFQRHARCSSQILDLDEKKAPRCRRETTSPPLLL